MRRGTSVAVIVSLLVMTSMSACLGGEESTVPKEIGSIVFVDMTDHFLVGFTLLDNNGKEIASEGTVDLELFDDFSNLLYQESFFTSESDFAGNSPSSGLPAHSCSWNISFLDIEESDARDDSLNANLTFVFDGTTLSKESSSVPFPGALKSPNKPPNGIFDPPSEGWTKHAILFRRIRDYRPKS